MSSQVLTASSGVPSPSDGSPVSTSYMSLGYPPSYYPQYPQLAQKHGDSPNTIYPSPYYLAPVPHIQPQVHGPQDGDATGYPSHQTFYPAAVYAPVPYHHHPQYATIPRSDGHPSIHAHYSLYPPSPPYHNTKPSSPAEIVNGTTDRLHHAPNGVAGKAG